MTEHDKIFDGIVARWNYLESGHGKGPCDGLGASVKRGADMAIRQGKSLIQDAFDFYAWAKQTEETGSKVKYIWYSQQDIDDATDYLKQQPEPLPVTGTFKIHAVVPVSRNSITTRELSCYCESCIKDERTKEHGWEEHYIQKENSTSSEIVDDLATSATDNVVLDNVGDDTRELSYQKDSWVSAVYDDEWFIGKVVNQDVNEVEIDFLTLCGKYKTNKFKWPLPRDQIWIDKGKVLTVLEEEPTLIGGNGEKSNLHEIYQVKNEDMKRILEVFSK